MNTQTIADRLHVTPTKPGVYLMLNATNKILYVGKAASLRSRLRSYFGSRINLDIKTRMLVSQIADFEYVVTETEAEALILENTFIKQHKPQFNIRLKDDKTYPFIKIDLNEDFPQICFTRYTQSDGARYFGPFASAGSMRTTMKLLKKLFPYRSCTKTITGTDDRACLEYYIQRCVAPCIGAVSRDEYREVIHQVVLFLEGKTDKVLRSLTAKMSAASEKLEFERAASLRDQIKSINRISENQKVVSQRTEDQDIVALAISGQEAWVEVFFIRQGKLTGHDHFIMEGAQDETPSQILRQFIKQFYGSTSHLPRKILLEHPITEDIEVIETWLAKKSGHRVTLETPKRGPKLHLVEMARENAAHGLQQRAVQWLTDTSKVQLAMSEIAEALNLPRLPLRIECYDISNISGTNSVGSMVTFENGRPKANHYRRFQIKSVNGINDYSMMQEVLRRRFQRLSEHTQIRDHIHQEQPIHGGQPPKDESWHIVPDLVLIDGGKGHLAVALEVLLEFGIADTISLASLAKEREELYVPHNTEPTILPIGSQGLFLIQRIRDEAHRFAITYHRQRRSKAAIKSVIDMVPGIGPKRRKMIHLHIGSISHIKAATLEELASVPGMTTRLALKVKEYL
ncbi:excinuclease ABC subunit UvrC [Dehalococcoidia bacterium]|nr:excinuclease ABC subunit UvrC [Dehalococcoidia bacterium]